MNNFRDYVDDPRLMLQHLPPPLQTAAEYAPHVIRWLINYLISPIIYHFQNLGYQLTRLTSTPPSELQTQDIFFPLLSLILIYFAVTSALHTARYAFHMGSWLLKWGTLIGIVAVAWAWLSADPSAVGHEQHGYGYSWGRGTSTIPSLVDRVWKMVNGEQQREWLVKELPEVDWSGWVPEWVALDGGFHWIEVIDGLGAENVRKAAEEWWKEQMDSKPSGSKGKKKTSSWRLTKEKKQKTSTVR
ncbi:hypothetical protein DACRYDRAFT_111930 [Dacryopinax primogenitus]|uniref:Uncharacterized protein n=1 Tax=Dacryopinax primogenitus (strain DJM 731) TaxID=1858805 RepID=M5FR72_DACPD|nr:uncharacterized protein DACRYDRAFT_111930 [Dacryopinax primogenitus]EJT97389.1 hypothetical protein DACRYDRAFT_111930 [Dacryopinax primogenitus]